MLFNSSSFAIFCPPATTAYFLTPARFRWLTLLVASSLFYMAFIPAYVLILFGMILVDYAAGLLIEPATGGARRALLAMSLLSNVGLLALFKYYNFAARTLEQVSRLFGETTSVPGFAWVLPIGLSFHTFQAMAYTIEVYRGRWRAERHLGIYALYVMFFPQLVAGPIERAQHLLPQLHEAHRFDRVRAVSGVKLMAWGLFKKVVVADRLAAMVNAVYAMPSAYHGPAIVVATVFFAFQIYCDFSGYSDIAIGAAEVLGVRLVANFRRPYLSRSTREFWSRWHISLSTWFRDYVYIPLGGRDPGRARWAFNLLVTFLISGLWHGANWTYVLWGALNGLYVVAGHFTGPFRARVREVARLSARPSLERAVQTAITFALITTAWVFFRAASLHDVAVIFARATDWSAFEPIGPTTDFVMACLLTGLLFTIECLQPGDDIRDWVSASPVWVRWPAYYALITLTLALGIFQRSRFIYFQF